MNIYKVHISRIMLGEEIFRLHDEKGFPLEFSCFLANEKGLVIDWEGFIKRAKETGNFNIERLLGRIVTACKDAGYNDEWWEKKCLEEPDKFSKEES